MDSPHVLGPIFEHARDATIVIDAGGTVLATNRAARETYAHHTLVYAISIELATFRSDLERLGTARAETHLVDSEGRAREVILHGRSIGTRHVVAFEDVSELRKLERSLRQVQRIDSLGYLMASTIQDLNNLLTPILLYGALLEPYVAEAPHALELVRDLADTTRRAAALVTGLHSFVRRVPAGSELVSLNGVLDDLRPFIGRLLGAEYELVVSLEPNLPPTRVDRLALENAILNLIANARDAMPAGGPLTIQTFNALNVGEAREPDLGLRITDAGGGLSDDEMGLLFVNRFAVRSGGRLTVQTKPGVGTSVTVHLPRANGAVSGKVRAVGRTHEGTILIVERDAQVRRALRLTLDECGYRVLESASSVAATSLAELYEGDIDLLVAEAAMPGLLGVELLERLRQSRPRLQGLFLGGRSDAKGAQPVLRKPFSAHELLSSVRAALEHYDDDSSTG